MNQFKILMLFLILLGSTCSNTKKKFVENITPLSDSIYTLFPEYEKSDARRYGVFPDSLNNSKHPKTGKSKMHSLIEFAQYYPGTITFQKGYYGTNLLFDSKQNIHFKFNGCEFNLVHITNEGGTSSSNIELEGTLILYDRFGTYESNKITVDSLIIKSNANKNTSGDRSRGCHIYKGTSDLTIKYLEIDDLASGADVYKNNHAALALDGLRNNPKNITVDEVVINASDRHGAYITGENVIIKKLAIKKYALGSTTGMTQMQDAENGEERELSGLWINRCNNCEFDVVTVYTKAAINSKYALKLDEGNSAKPTIINELNLDIPYKDSIILDDVLTNVLVKKIDRITND